MRSKTKPTHMVRLASAANFKDPVKLWLPASGAALVLAPMQHVTDLPFMRVIARRGGPDWFVTEFIRVHESSSLDRYIMRSIDENSTGKPIVAQLIGSDRNAMARIARLLQQHPIAGIDLNLGCPSPTVCGKNAGGGLLRHPAEIDALIGTLREVVDLPLTVKTRLGYASCDEFETLLAVFSHHAIDGLTIHARTVVDRYQTPVRPAWVKTAALQLTCPIIANGNVVNADAGLELLSRTQAAGLMIGRGAIRNPWIFDQIRARQSSTVVPRPCGEDLLKYIEELYEEIALESRDFNEDRHVQRMKKTMLYIVQGHGEILEQQMRRVHTSQDFFSICRQHFSHREPLADVPPESSKLFCGFSELLPRVATNAESPKHNQGAEYHP